MLKLSVSVSRKIPGAAEYSSDGFLCALEAEVSDSAVNNPQELRERLVWLWAEAKRSVEDQIGQNGNGRNQARPSRSVPSRGNGQPASAKQIRYVISLGQQQGMSMADLRAFLKEAVGVADPSKLSRAFASTVIDRLSKGGGRS